MRSICFAIVAGLCAWLPADAGEMRFRTSPRVAAYFEKARENRATLVAFLHKMPKGADLHNHLPGAVYAETLIAMARDMGLYFDRTTKHFTDIRPDGPHFAPDELAENYVTAGEIIEAISLRGGGVPIESGHDHFFRSFNRFEKILPDELPILREVLRRAARQGVSHLELMTLPHTDPAWRSAVETAVSDVREEAIASGVCSAFELRFIYPLVRLEGPEAFRLQVEDAFAVAAAMPDLVSGITILAPEDDPVSQAFFDTHMAILADAMRAACERHRQDPSGNPPPPRLALHAGELTLDIATYESMTDRIAATIRVGKASRIGHGTAIMWDDDVYNLLRQMRECGIAVEFCPSSAEQILGVTRAEHPFPLYWAAGVPVVIGTDDEGVSRSNITMEFAKAAEWFGLSYGEMKWLAFESLERSFLPGQSMFVGGNFNFPRSDGTLGDRSRKARMQERLLDDFARFEARMETVLDDFGW